MADPASSRGSWRQRGLSRACALPAGLLAGCFVGEGAARQRGMDHRDRAPPSEAELAAAGETEAALERREQEQQIAGGRPQRQEGSASARVGVTGGREEKCVG